MWGARQAIGTVFTLTTNTYPIEDKTVPNLTQYNDYDYITQYYDYYPLPSTSRLLQSPSSQYPPPSTPFHFPPTTCQTYTCILPSSPFPLPPRPCQTYTCNPPSSTPLPPPPPWDKRGTNDENYPQSQKFSLGWCIECGKPFSGMKCGHEVVLKVIKGSQKNLDEFINELSAHHKFSKKIGHVLRCFGVSRWEDTGDFIVVTSYAKDGNLRQYIRKKVGNFPWIKRKREQLVTIYNSFQDAEDERKNSMTDSIIYIPTIDQTSQLISIK
ncbi:unnamed protein product [Rhizophagus irregularis]|nr:unnamed protein product [Rhizophagus irregularis]